MIKVRSSVFETNSSSSHSLVFSKVNRGHSYDLPVDENGVLTIPFGEFGWGPEVLKTPLEKLSYIVTDRGGWQYDDDEKPWEKILEELKENAKIQQIIKIVKRNDPAVKEVTFAPASEVYPRGYIDHESIGTSKRAKVEDIIFNSNIIILIDNDNSSYFADYFDGWNGDPATKDVEDLFLKEN